MDFFGETMMQDVEELLKILISDDAKTAFDDYKVIYNSVIETVASKVKDVSGDPSFLFMVASMSTKNGGTYYNDNSELGKITESLHGHNAITDIDSTSKTVTTTPQAEAIVNYDGLHHIEYVFIRGNAANTPATDFNTFTTRVGTSNLYAINNHHVFVIHTDILSGPRDYIGRVCLCEAFGISTGLDYQKLTTDFDEKYGFGVTYPYIMQQMPAA
jgi:hypothetical protein